MEEVEWGEQRDFMCNAAAERSAFLLDSPASFSELHFEFSEESSFQIGKPVFSFIFNIELFFFLPLSVRDMET